MGEVVDLADRRAQRREERMHSALMHPSLRWLADGDVAVAHRRDTDDGTTVCGARGTLTLADTGVALCTAGCFPLVGKPRAAT